MPWSLPKNWIIRLLALILIRKGTLLGCWSWRHLRLQDPSNPMKIRRPISGWYLAMESLTYADQWLKELFMDTGTVLKGLSEGCAFWITVGHIVWEWVGLGHVIETLQHCCHPKSSGPIHYVTPRNSGHFSCTLCGSTRRRGFCEPAEHTVRTTPSYQARTSDPGFLLSVFVLINSAPLYSYILFFLGQILQSTFWHIFPRVWPT